METPEFIAVLLSWAAGIAGYPYPETRPTVVYRDQSFFEQHACADARRCRAAAWYDDEGSIYLHEELADLEDPVVRSVVVHELVHYLQDLSGQFVAGDCRDSVRREREAYSAQRTYLNRVAGRFMATYAQYAPCPGDVPPG